jgi:hypothetical protein
MARAFKIMGNKIVRVTLFREGVSFSPPECSLRREMPFKLLINHLCLHIHRFLSKQHCYQPNSFCLI